FDGENGLIALAIKLHFPRVIFVSTALCGPFHTWYSALWRSQPWLTQWLIQLLTQLLTELLRVAHSIYGMLPFGMQSVRVNHVLTTPRHLLDELLKKIL